MPKEVKKQLKTDLFKFIWQKNIQTIAQQKITRPRHLGGTGLFDLETRQQALWLQEVSEIILDPNSDVNLLRRGTLGPIPNLAKYFKENNIKPSHVNMTETPSDRTKFLRNYLKNKIPLETNLRNIYDNLHEETITAINDQLEQYSHLSKVKHPKLWQYGYLTIHNGHKTRHWLYSRNFNLKDVQKSKGQCEKCQQNETQNHIIQSVRGCRIGPTYPPACHKR